MGSKTEKAYSILWYGNAFKDKNSWHYKAHQSLEAFWDNYRVKGVDPLANGQILRVLCDSMIFAGFSDEATYIESKAYTHQESYGLEITEPVPNVPNPMHQQKVRGICLAKRGDFFASKI